MSQRQRCGCHAHPHVTDEGGDAEGLMNLSKITEKAENVPARAAFCVWKLPQNREVLKKSPRRAGHIQGSELLVSIPWNRKAGICLWPLLGRSGHDHHAYSFTQIRREGLQA